MADHEAPALETRTEAPPDRADYDPNASPFRQPEIEWSEPGPDVWGFLERVWRRLKRADEAA
jgi:hypothetical protein